MATGMLAVNVMHFVRLLRRAGLRLGPAAVLDALAALDLIDLGQREDVRACLRAVLVRRREDRELLDQAFQLFFRDPFGVNQTLALLLPHTQPPPDAPPSALPRRLAEAFHPPRPVPPRPPEERIEFDAALTWSAAEVLETKDFAEMSAEELREARRLLERLELQRERHPVRRSRPAPRGGRVDLRATLRASLRGGGHDIPLRYRVPREEPPPLVLLCDISGSMSRYSEMLLRFVHLLASERRRTHCFVFGTRLTNVTRALARRDVDDALRRVGTEAEDWGGGTRIGACLHEFNRAWSRRVLGQGAVVLLITDGLDRGEGETLAHEAERLAKSCRRLVWLNPLLGYAGFEPRAQGIRALLPHVDEFRPVHNLVSLEQLAAALGPRGAASVERDGDLRARFAGRPRR